LAEHIGGHNYTGLYATSPQTIPIPGLDEFKELSRKLPPLDATVSVPKPLVPRLRELTPDHLDIIQIALGKVSVQAILDQSRQTDLDTAQSLLSLLERGYLVVG
jgi:hypothetical protein